MTASNDDAQPSSAIPQPPTSPVSAADQVLHDIQAVNEELLIAGLREQRLAEQLQRQLAFTTAITTSLGEGVYVLDTEGRCTFVNPAAEHILGWTNEELRTQTINVIFPNEAKHHEVRDHLPTLLMDVLRLGTSYRTDDALFVHRDGGMFPVAYSAAPIITDGNVVGVVVTFRDMTEVRRLQRAREEYVALISHDLRTPLTVVFGRAQTLLRQLTERGLEREVASAKMLVESSRRLSAMIEDIVAGEHAGARVIARQRAAVNLVAVVQQVREQSIMPTDQDRVTINAVDALSIVVDVVQIERVIANLLVNALKFSSPDSPIIVNVYQSGAHAMVAVTDRGIGIAPQDVPHLFEKHYRAQAVGQIAGSGLGLYSSRLIVEAHGGHLEVESTVGIGSTFIMRLPLVSKRN